MTRVSTQFSDQQQPVRQPLSKSELRVVGTICVLGVAFGVIVGLLVAPEWEVGLACGLMAVPGGLLGGALAVSLQRRGIGENTTIRQKIVSLSFIALLIAAEIALQSVVPSVATRLLILTFIPAGIVAVWQLYRRVTTRR